MSNVYTPISAAQIGKLIQTLNGVDATRFHERGIPLAHLLAEYLRQDHLRPLSLMGARQMLGLPLKRDMVFARVSWTKRIPEKRLSEHAVRSGFEKRMWTDLVRLHPEDLGLVSEDVQPEEVFNLALQWGFNPMPCEVASALVRATFSGQKQIGDLTAFHDFSGHVAPMVFRIQNAPGSEWFVRQATSGGMRRRLNSLADECWSILVASETSAE